MGKIKFKIKKGDTVAVIAGNSKGKQGVVKTILTEKQRVIIEGVNMVTRHFKPSVSNPEGGIVKKEASIHISNVMLVDPNSSELTRIGRKLKDDGKGGMKLKRYSKKTQEFID